MIIKNAAFIFDLLNNKLSRSITFETIGYFKATNSNNVYWSNLGLLQSNDKSERNLFYTNFDLFYVI